MNETVVEIYADGACSGNPGPGGYGAILRFGDKEKELFGSEALTTNNRMELMAVIKGLTALNRASIVEVYTDSQYVQQGMTTWLSNWKKKNWKTADGKVVKNQDLWQQLDELVKQHQVTFHWIRGHDGHIENERADALARSAIKR